MYAMVSYQKLCPQDTPKAVRRRLYIGDIFENKAKCLVCSDIIMSKNRHDYVRCSCGSLSVDGGSWYLKRSYNDLKAYRELSTYYYDAGISND